MLKFLNERTHEKQKRSPIKYEPSMVYGISAQSPSCFQTPFTLIHKRSYVNPYVEFEKSRSNKICKENAHLIKPSWTKKVNLQLIEEQMIVSSQTENVSQFEESRYNKSYYNQFNRSPNRFRKTKGEMTNFIEKNNHYKSIGPLHGVERTMERIESTKKSVWLKPDTTSSKNSILKSTGLQNMRQKSQSTTKTQKTKRYETAVSSNSKLITEKIRIRCNRDKTNIDFKNKLQMRKKSSLYNFEFPRLKSEFIMPVMPNLRNQKVVSEQNKRPIDQDFIDEMDGMDGMDNLENFQTKLTKKFK